jgi:hypothetical protein
MFGIRVVICTDDLQNTFVDIGQSNKTIDCGTLIKVVTIAFNMKTETYVCPDQMKQSTTVSVATEHS